MSGVLLLYQLVLSTDISYGAGGVTVIPLVRLAPDNTKVCVADGVPNPCKKLPNVPDTVMVGILVTEAVSDVVLVYPPFDARTI